MKIPKKVEIHEHEFTLTELVVCLKLLLNPILNKLEHRNMFADDTLKAFNGRSYTSSTGSTASVFIEPVNWKGNSYIRADIDLNSNEVMEVRIEQQEQLGADEEGLGLFLRVVDPVAPMKFVMVEHSCRPASIALFKNVIESI